MEEIGTDENFGDREHCIYIYQLWTCYEVIKWDLPITPQMKMNCCCHVFIMTLISRATNDGSRICQHWQRSANCKGHFRCEYIYSNLFIYQTCIIYTYVFVQVQNACQSSWKFIFSYDHITSGFQCPSVYRQTRYTSKLPVFLFSHTFPFICTSLRLL
jgi:hypothetical protein